MSVLDQLASAIGRNDEVPNQLLAKQITSNEDMTSVQVLVDALSNQDTAIQSACIKVLYEIGGLQPKLIAGYVNTFAELLSTRNNRLVWGHPLEQDGGAQASGNPY